jgi:RNase adapter protein RapZ
MRLVIVSGLSGSGKSVALRTLEDLGYYSIDNLPVFLLKELALGLTGTSDNTYTHTAVGIDARNTEQHLRDLPELIVHARAHGIECRVLFLEADTDTLITRFSETRRKHPLTRADRPLAEAIEMERRILAPIRREAEVTIDTTRTNVHELRELVRERIAGNASPKAAILLQSFGFKSGVPHDVDFLFDVRCLPNPHWRTDLRPLTGRDPAVVDFLETNAEVGQMRADLIAFFDRWVPRFETDGRSYLTVAFGCTGGQHRSVYMVEAMRRHFEDGGHSVTVRHRDLP